MVNVLFCPHLQCAGKGVEYGLRPILFIVDDEPVILQILRNVFEDEPYRVTCVANGEDALRVIQEQGDLLLTDKNLPDINGIELLRQAKEQDPNTEVIIITRICLSLKQRLQHWNWMHLTMF